MKGFSMIQAISSETPIQNLSSYAHENTAPQFKANTQNNFERTPENDSFDKKSNKGVKIGLGVLVTAGLLAAGDVIFAKGKHLKSLFGSAEKETKNIEQKAEQEIKKEAMKMTEESRKIHSTIEKHCHGKLNTQTIRINDSKSDELKKLGSYYHAEEINSAKRAAAEAAKKAEEEFMAKYEPIAAAKMEKEGKKLFEEARKNYKDITNKYHHLQEKGFQSIKGNIEILEDGSKKITRKLDDGKSTIEFISKDGKNIDSIVKKRNDVKIHEMEFRDQYNTGELAIYDDSGKNITALVTSTDRNGISEYADHLSERGKFISSTRRVYWDGCDNFQFSKDGLFCENKQLHTTSSVEEDITTLIKKYLGLE